MKLVAIIPRLNYSGAPKIMSWVINQMSLHGFDVSILVLYSSEVEQHLAPGIKTICLGIKQSRSRLVRLFVQIWYVIRKIVDAIKKENPNFVLSFLDTTGFFISFFRKILFKNMVSQPKIMVSERCDPYTGYNNIVASFFKKRALEKSDMIVFQTTGAKDYFSKRIQSKSVVIPNPVISPKNSIAIPYSQRKNYIVSVGRLFNKQKRYDVLLKSFKLVQRENDEVFLHIYGDGEDLEFIRKMIGKLKLKNVCCFGAVSNVIEKIQYAKAFVISSDYEGIPNSLIEAMVAGVPCVSTNCRPGGAAFLIVDGVNGYIVPRGDYKAMSKKILKLLDDEEISNIFSKESPKIKNRYSESVISKMWIDAFAKIAGSNK